MKIKNIKKGYKIEVFDLSVENQHHFELSNGVIAHNCDALTTYLLYPIALEFTKEAKLSGFLDNYFLYPFQKCEEQKTAIDVEYLLGFQKEVDDALTENTKKIFELAGEPFNISSTKQKSLVLEKLKVKLPKSEKTGLLKASKDLLDKIKLKHPIIPLLLEHSELKQNRNSYLKPLLRGVGLNEDPEKNKDVDLTIPRGVRFSYQLTVASTSRLSGGKDSNNSFFPSKANIQNFRKPKSQLWSFRKLEEDLELASDSELVLGYEFNPNSELYEFKCEGFKPQANIRKAFRASSDNSCLWVGIDFCIDPESLVELKNGSKTPLKNLKNNPQEIKTPNGYQLAHSYRETGKKEKCVLTLKSGKKVVCSPDHKFKVLNLFGEEIWKPLNEIIPSDIVVEI